MSTTKEKTQEAQSKAQDAYHLAEEAASEAVSSLKNKANESLNDGTEKVKAVKTQAELLVMERPLLSIGCAFLAGWAVSKLIK